MRDRIQIRKTAPQQWTVTRPRLGFGAPEVTTWSRWAEARDHIALVLASRQWGGTETDTDRPAPVTDCLNPISPWTPLWFPGDNIRT